MASNRFFLIRVSAFGCPAKIFYYCFNEEPSFQGYMGLKLVADLVQCVREFRCRPFETVCPSPLKTATVFLAERVMELRSDDFFHVYVGVWWICVLQKSLRML